MEVLLQLQGQEALVPHNERTQDPLDPFTQAIAAISGKRKKTEADYWDLAKLEFEAGLYTDPPIEAPGTANGNSPGIPAMNIFRCLQDGATRMRRGKDVPRGIRPAKPFAELVYDGPRDIEGMWSEYQEFSIRKGVVVSGRRVTRTRPLFKQWAAFLPIVVDPTIWNVPDLALAWKNAGQYAGLGDMRPIYGQFEGTLTSDWDSLKVSFPAPEQGFEAAIAFIREYAQGYNDRHNGKPKKVIPTSKVRRS
jgi:hypothetical protein